MSKDSFRFSYDPLIALNNAEKLLGMQLRPCGPNRLAGGYYINGEPHPYRKEKLKVFISRGSVWVSEEGGPILSLPNWLVQYGGAADFRDALRMIKGESQALHWNGEVRKKAVQERKTVPPDVLIGAKAFDLKKCNLFNWMCSLFPEEKVRAAWDLYNVTTDWHGNAVYWFVDRDGKILFDKRIAYKDDGHRDRNVFPGRYYRISDGFSGKCYFGANTVKDAGKIYVCESEKTAILVYLMYGRQCVATGGKGNLREVDPRMVLLPDMDGRAEWSEKGEVWPWWEKWGIPVETIPGHADIGDMIEWKMKLCGKTK